MPRPPKEGYTKFFDVRVKRSGEVGNKLQDIVKSKMKADNRQTLENTVEAIIIEYDAIKKKK